MDRELDSIKMRLESAVQSFLAAAAEGEERRGLLFAGKDEEFVGGEAYSLELREDLPPVFVVVELFYGLRDRGRVIFH